MSDSIQECEMFVAASKSLERYLESKDNDVASVIFCAGTPVDRAQSLVELQDYVENLGKRRTRTKRPQGSCVGFLTQKQAEKKVRKRHQFVTYYRTPDRFETPIDSSITLNLSVCYLDNQLEHKHYQVNKITSPSSEEVFFQLAFPEKSSSEPIFVSIENLLSHYTQFGYVDSFDSEGGLNVEIFPK